ncbi:helix-turn-helix transcriptional regulator [Kitasatospora sp. NPDC059571]|uniref:helix-turn-helix transcriptional regulator n=1 Tax=Kitasatospora sp. NPDC059571 TaxID=3346871 RepID=UPI00369BC21F
MGHDESPTARVLLLLDLVQSSPGITAERLAQRLGVSERATRRYVGILREAGVPITSRRGPHGGYAIGRGYRLPPLMFSTAEALGLVMAVLESGADAGDPADPVGSALGKIVRVLPASLAGPAEAVRGIGMPAPDGGTARPDPATAAALVQACAAQRRIRLEYRRGPGEPWVTEVDPWAVAVRDGRWYLLCWSHARSARRLLRVDRVAAVAVLDAPATPPDGLDPVAAVDEHLAQGWRYRVEVLVDAPAASVARWIPRSLGQCEEVGPHRTRLLATTDEPDWYARRLTAIGAPFRVVAPPELREAVRELGRRLLLAGGPEDGPGEGAGAPVSPPRPDRRAAGRARPASGS